MKNSIIFIIVTLFFSCQAQRQSITPGKVKDISLPEYFNRQHTDSGSFAFYLQNLPLNNSRQIVMLYNNLPKKNQKAHYAIIDMDTGNKDLQQCADAIMRLRAEYLWSQGQKKDIHFNFTSGDTANYVQYMKGFRPQINANKILWHKTAHPDSSYTCFRNYLNLVFTYAGTYSLNKELLPVDDPQQIHIGDVFIQTGNPYGHAVIVIDIAINAATKAKVFLLAQSYMPAQDIHILMNPNSEELNPWYKLEPEKDLTTPEWTFSYTHLKRFKEN